MESGEKLPQLFFNGDATFSMPCPLTDLRKLAPKWSLAGDAQLLGFMQNFSNKLIAQTKDIQKQLNSLTYKTKTMDVKLNNVFNDFNMLANTQFVENRVYDEDSCILQQPVEEQPKKLEMTEKERDAEMMMMMNEAVRLCKKALDRPSDPVRKDRYAARTLPTLLNRQQTPQVEDRTRAKSANQVESSSDDPPKPEEADKLSQTSDASEARRPSSSLESSLKTESLQGRKESTKDIFADDNEDSDGDLFSRPAKVPKIVPAKSKDQLVSTLDAMFKDRTTKQEIASSSSSLASDRLAKENKGKVKSLFDESDSAEEDIFEQISNIVNKRPSTDQSTLKANNNESILPSTKKVPIGAVSVFGNSLDGRRQSLVQSQKLHLKDKEGVDTFVQPSSSSSSSSLDSKSKQPNLMTKKPVGLFDDDEDDDGDLFSATNKKPPVEFNQPKPREPIKTIAEAEARDKLLQKVQKPVPVKSLFDDDDDDDDDEDIFSKLAKQSTKAVEDVRTKDVEAKFPTSAVSSLSRGVDPPKKSETPKKIRSIFDDDDDEEVNDMVLSVNKDDEVLPVNKDVKTTTQAIQNPTPKIKSIFDDDDDDGPDLFQNLLKSTKKVASEAKDELNTQSKADASETEPPEALPPGEKKNSVPSVSGIPQASKTRKSLFDDDEEDEEDDLFSSLLKTKPPPVVKKEDIGEQQPQTTTRPQKQQTTTTTKTSTTDKSEQQKPTTLVTDSKGSELKTSISPQKSKVKGDRISKLQNSLNIDPLSLGPFSHKKVQKELMDKIYKDDAANKDKDDKDSEDDKVEDEEHGNRSKSAVVFGVGGNIGLPSADTTKNSLHDGGKNTPDDEDALTDKSDLNVGSTNTLPSLVKGRPKMIGRRRPTTRNKSFENVDDENFSQSNANIESTEREVLSNENIPEMTSRSNDFLVHQPKDLMEVQKDQFDPDDSIRRPSRLFGDVEGDESPFSESVDKTSRDSLVHRHHGTLKQDDVKDFFETGSYIYEEKVEKNPCNFKSNDFEPPPLFSDGDDDDDEEAGDLFGNFQKGADFSENDVFNVKRGAARSKGVEDKIKEESKTTPEKNVVLAFDDYDEDEDDDDLFAPPKPASEPSKKPEPSVAKTTPVQVAPMFGNDDDDDDADLFSDVSLTMKSASKPELPPPNLSSSSNGPEKTTTAKANVTPDDRNVAQTSSSNPAGKSIFEELEDGDLFSEESSVRVVAQTTSSNPAGKSEFNSGKSLFGDLEDEDLFEDLVSKPTKNAKGPTKTVIKQGNLFDDSDDDIFNSSTTYNLPSKGGTKAPTLRDGGVGKSSNLFGDPLSNL